MKSLAKIALIATLAASPIVAQAEEANEIDLHDCEVQLREYFGQDAKFQLVEQRRNAHGTKVRMVAHLDADNAYFATCWLPKAEATAYEEVGTQPMLAVTPAPVQAR